MTDSVNWLAITELVVAAHQRKLALTSPPLMMRLANVAGIAEPLGCEYRKDRIVENVNHSACHNWRISANFRIAY